MFRTLCLMVLILLAAGYAHAQEFGDVSLPYDDILVISHEADQTIVRGNPETVVKFAMLVADANWPGWMLDATARKQITKEVLYGGDGSKSYARLYGKASSYLQRGLSHAKRHLSADGVVFVEVSR